MPDNPVDFIDFAHAANSTESGAQIVSKILVACDGNLFFGKYGAWTGLGGVYNNSTGTYSSVSASQQWWIVDGAANTSGTLISVSAIDGTVERFPTGSTAQPPDKATIINLYRNRLVMTGTESDPHNWFMSEVGNYTSHDYSVESTIAAVAGNNSDAGKIGDRITGFIPFSDDYGIFGCEDSTWILRGDPAAGGRIDNLIWGGGLVGPQAYARDSEGRIYYLSRTDLMQIPPGGGVPSSISSGRIQRFLSRIDFSVTKVRMAWDAQRKGLWIFFTGTSSTAGTHLHWDQRLDAFTTHEFPAVMGPTAVHSLVGEVYQDRQLLLGTFDGHLWTMDPGWTTDNGTAIESALAFCPTALGEMGERSIITETEIVIGNIGLPVSCTLEWFTGDNPQAAVTSTDAKITATVAQAGRYLKRGRARGNAAVFRLSNEVLARSWAYEQGHILTLPAGRVK